jgi:hypothetical protein
MRGEGKRGRNQGKRNWKNEATTDPRSTDPITKQQ